MAGSDTLQFIPLQYGDPAAEAFFDATQEVLGTLGRLDLTLASATTVRALAGPGADESGMGIGGALRWIDANVDQLHPGGAAGRFDIYVTTGPTTIAPGTPPTDTTDYSYALAIVPAGAAAPGTAYAKRVGYLDWDGAAITRLVQTFMRRDDAPRAAVAPTGTVSPVEAIAPAGATAPPIRAQVGNTEVFRVNPDGSLPLVGNLTAPRGYFQTNAKDAISLTGAGAGITFGGDVNVYRDSQDVLRTDDNIWAAFNIASQVGAAAQTTIGGVGAGGAAGILMNDVSLYRAAAALIATASGLRLGANLQLAFDGSAILFGAAGDASLARAAANALSTPGALTIGGDLRQNGANLGFYGVAPVARAAARAQANWTLAANALRSIDRNTYTINNLFDYVATLVADLQAVGLLA